MHASLEWHPCDASFVCCRSIFNRLRTHDDASIWTDICRYVSAMGSGELGSTRVIVPGETKNTNFGSYLWMSFCQKPILYATWMDECWLRKVSKTIQLTSSNTAQHRVLERWLMAIPLNLKKMSDKPFGWEKSQPGLQGDHHGLVASAFGKGYVTYVRFADL